MKSEVPVFLSKVGDFNGNIASQHESVVPTGRVYFNMCPVLASTGIRSALLLIQPFLCLCLVTGTGLTPRQPSVCAHR